MNMNSSILANKTLLAIVMFTISIMGLYAQKFIYSNKEPEVLKIVLFLNSLIINDMNLK